MIIVMILPIYNHGLEYKIHYYTHLNAKNAISQD